MRSISETSPVIALTDQNAIFGNVRKIQQKCQLTLQQGQEYELPHSVEKTGWKKRVSCNGTLTVLPMYKAHPSPTHYVASA